MTTQAKRIYLVFGVLFAALLVCALVGAYMISRDVAFDFERPDVNEANSFRRKLRKFDEARKFLKQATEATETPSEQ